MGTEQSQPERPRVEFSILGPLTVVVDGTPLVVGRRREATLLARLLVEGGRAVSDGELIDSVWANGDLRDPIHALRTTVSRLRAALGPAGADLIERTPRGYRLDMTAAVLDADRFGALAERAERAEDPNDRVDLLDQALSLWRGSALGEFTEAHFAMAASIRYEEERGNAIEALLIARLERGEDAALVPELEQAVADHPLREELWRALMLALYRAGRQGEALRGFQRARTALAAVGIDPGRRLRKMEEAILRHDPALSGAGHAGGATIDTGPVTHLPAIDTTFVGREPELALVADLVRSERFVTLTGPAGVGKSRLAIEVARAASTVFNHGVVHIDLHGAEQPDELPGALQSGLGLWGMLRPELDSPRATVPHLVETLKTRDHLLVLDGCERVAGETAELADELLGQCPHLHVLVTSTTPLDRDGEVVYPISPLAVERTDPGAADIDGAMKLFADRARLVVRGFQITETNRSIVADIVTKLDGLPLAIELAAARAGSLPLTSIAARLDSLLRSESDGRTIEATLRWSYDQLGSGDRDIFDAVSTLVGPWEIEAAASVCREDASEIEAAVARLMRLSLLTGTLDAAGRQRYAMLGVVRAFGRANLEAAGLSHELAGRAAAYFLDELRSRVRRLAGPEEASMLAWFHSSSEDLIAALDWLLEHDPAGAVVGTTAAAWFWIRLGYPNAARGLHTPGLRIDAAPPVQAAWACMLGCWTGLLSRPVTPGSRRFVLPLVDSRATFGRDVRHEVEAHTPVAMAERAVELFEGAGHERGAGLAMTGLALATAAEGRFEEAETFAREAVERERAAGGGPWELAATKLVAANVALGQDRVEAAVGLASEALGAFVSQGDGFMAAWNHDTLARAAIVSGRLDDAETHWIEALAYRPHTHPARVLIPCWLGLLKMNAGLYEEAAAYFADALATAREIGTDEAMVAVRLCLGEWHSQRGDSATARAMYEEAAKRAVSGDASLTETVHLALAVADVRDRDVDTARARVRRRLRAWASEPGAQIPAGTTDVLAACAVAEGRTTRAAVLSGVPDPAPEVLFLRILLGRTRAETDAAVVEALGRREADAARAVGRGLSAAEVVAFALSEDDRPSSGGE